MPGWGVKNGSVRRFGPTMCLGHSYWFSSVVYVLGLGPWPSHMADIYENTLAIFGRVAR